MRRVWEPECHHDSYAEPNSRVHAARRHDANKYGNVHLTAEHAHNSTGNIGARTCLESIAHAVDRCRRRSAAGFPERHSGRPAHRLRSVRRTRRACNSARDAWGFAAGIWWSRANRRSPAVNQAAVQWTQPRERRAAFAGS